MSTPLSPPSAPRYPAAFRIDPPDQPVGGTIRLPGSKSITNRSLLIAGLARGSSVLLNALFSEDTRYLANALLKLGVIVRADERGARFGVDGAGGPFPAREAELFLATPGPPPAS